MQIHVVELILIVSFNLTCEGLEYAEGSLEKLFDCKTILQT